MEIINTHLHLGGSRLIDSYYSEHDLLNDMDRNKQTGICVMPLTEPMPDNFKAHDRIYRMIKDNPDRKIWGIVDMHPRHDEDVYEKEVKRCIHDMGFIAVKFHPLLHAMNPNARNAKKVFDAARKFNVPLLIHTGLGIPFSLPALIIPRAKEYPDVKIVLCHSGGQLFAQEAEIAAELLDNIYLELSWVTSNVIRGLFDKVGKERIMFGSDGISNSMTQISQADSVGLTEDEKEWYFYKTARSVFRLN